MSRKFTDEDLANALSYDALQSAEQITGRSYKEDEDTAWLGAALHMRSGDTRRTLLHDAGDTTFSMALPDYLAVVTGAGFKTVLEVPFHHEKYGYDDRLIAMWHQDGILLVFDTYSSGRSVNGGHFYYNVRFHDGVSNAERFDVTSSGGFRDGVWSGNHDCREAVLFNIRRLKSVGEFINPWVHQPHLWLRHYGDREQVDRDMYRYREINKSRIAMLPQEIQKCINGKEQA